jgi:hypothetical protein
VERGRAAGDVNRAVLLYIVFVLKVLAVVRRIIENVTRLAEF